MSGFLNSELFSWVILPILIFISRIFDVTLGTIRIIFVSRGKRYLAPLLGFFEVMIWIMAISQIMQNLNNFACYVAYAGGFAAGTFVGIIIEEKLAIGMLIVRVILVKDECRLKERLSNAGFGVTVVDARGISGEVKIIYTIIKRKDLREVMEIINKCNSKAFYSIEDARKVSQGIFREGTSSNYNRTGVLNLFRFHRLSGLHRKMK
ncbi:MAG: DUF2179 domain-containing protein [Bacillota bacterium]